MASSPSPHPHRAKHAPPQPVPEGSQVPCNKITPTLYHTTKSADVVAGSKPESTRQQQVCQHAPVQNNGHTRDNIHTHSLALVPCPRCSNLNLYEGTIRGAEVGRVVCKRCGYLPEELQAAARQRQRKIIQAIFSPDDHRNPAGTYAAVNRNNPNQHQVNGKQRKKNQHVTKVNKSSTTQKKKVERNTMDTENNQDTDALLSDVPKYDEGDTDDGTDGKEEESLKDILRKMRRDFKAIGKKVDSFEGKLGKTQKQLGTLTESMEKAEANHTAYREEARSNAVETNSAIDGLKAAQVRLESNQTEALARLQEQVLKEIDDKISGAQNTTDAGIRMDVDNGNRGEWAKRASAPPKPAGENQRDSPIPTKYSDIATREERVRPQSTNTNGARTAIYVRDWKDESIGVVKKALRKEIGQITGGQPNHQKELWQDVDAVRHINQFGSPTSPLMEIICTPNKADILHEFFIKQGIEICDTQFNPCIDPAIHDNNESDNRKLATRLRNHFARLLLAWWKAAHYVYSPDTRLYYRRALLMLISKEQKLYEWPAFIKAIHIDANNVTDRKDNPRVWFEYKPGFDFLDEAGSNKKATVTIQSFSTGNTTMKTPAVKRRRPGTQEGIQGNDEMPTNTSAEVQSQTRSKHAKESIRQAENKNVQQGKAVARTLYSTPASTRRGDGEQLINQFIDNVEDTDNTNIEQLMFTQITNSNRKALQPSDPMAASSSGGGNPQ